MLQVRLILSTYNSDENNNGATVLAKLFSLSFYLKYERTRLVRGLRCWSYGSELARLAGMAHLGEIPPFLRNSFGKLSVFI